MGLPVQRLHKGQEHRAAAGGVSGREHGLGACGVLLVGGQEKGTGLVVDRDLPEVEGIVIGVLQAGGAEEVDQPVGGLQRTFNPTWSDHAGCRSHDQVGGVAGLAGGISGGQRRVADQVDGSILVAPELSRMDCLGTTAPTCCLRWAICRS